MERLCETKKTGRTVAPQGSVVLLHLLFRDAGERSEQGRDSSQRGGAEDRTPSNLRDHRGSREHGHSRLAERLGGTDTGRLDPGFPVAHKAIPFWWLCHRS